VIACRNFEKGQEGDFLTLYRGCLAHYGIPAATADQEARIIDLLARERHMSCLMAYDGDAPLGFATWGLTFPAAAGTALYMKELYVGAPVRGRGVGRALLAGLLDIAEAEGCVRMDWQTDGSNATAQAFYTAIQAPRHAKKTFRIEACDFVAFRDNLAPKQEI